jgi:ABC-2 type transport system ATP-binding protein
MCDRVAIIKEGRIISLEKISTLRENSYKRIKVETPSAVDENHLLMDGVTRMETQGNILSLLYRGNINLMLSKLTEAKPSNLLIEDPSLEEIFMHYYGKENEIR